MRAIEASRRSALSLRVRRRRDAGARFGLALMVLLIGPRLPTCSGHVNAEGRETDVEPPAAPLLAAACDQCVGEGKRAGLQIARGRGTFVDIEITAFALSEARPGRHASRRGHAVA